MNKKQVMNLVKKLTAGVLAVTMIVAGIVVYPKQADAAIVEDKVIYEECDSTDYWTADKKTAPVKEGYVFGGWFEKVTEQTDKTETATDGTSYNPLTTVSGTAYAKFVPAQVLSVKAQNQSVVNETYIQSFKNGEDSFYVRVMTSLDSANYQKVGFEILLANCVPVYKGDGTATETTRIYTGLKEGNVTKTANQIFGGESEYLGVWQLSKIDCKENVGLIIYVRPYWVTTDGTQVNGLAKYVHIEDQYLEYINVPVNLLGGEKVAAGAVNVTYNASEQLELKFEPGRIFEQMNCNHTGTTVKMVGNSDLAAGTYDENGETLYANLRFKKPTTNIEFSIVDDADTFCDWDEKFVDVKKVWNTNYVQTTNE